MGVLLKEPLSLSPLSLIFFFLPLFLFHDFFSSFPMEPSRVWWMRASHHGMPSYPFASFCFSTCCSFWLWPMLLPFLRFLLSLSLFLLFYRYCWIVHRHSAAPFSTTASQHTQHTYQGTRMMEYGNDGLWFFSILIWFFLIYGIPFLLLQQHPLSVCV